jgi:hypothetical protein
MSRKLARRAGRNRLPMQVEGGVVFRGDSLVFHAWAVLDTLIPGLPVDPLLLRSDSMMAVGHCPTDMIPLWNLDFTEGCELSALFSGAGTDLEITMRAYFADGEGAGSSRAQLCSGVPLAVKAMLPSGFMSIPPRLPPPCPPGAPDNQSPGGGEEKLVVISRRKASQRPPVAYSTRDRTTLKTVLTPLSREMWDASVASPSEISMAQRHPVSHEHARDVEPGPGFQKKPDCRFSRTQGRVGDFSAAPGSPESCPGVRDHNRSPGRAVERSKGVFPAGCQGREGYSEEVPRTDSPPARTQSLLPSTSVETQEPFHRVSGGSSRRQEPQGIAAHRGQVREGGFQKHFPKLPGGHHYGVDAWKNESR